MIRQGDVIGYGFQGGGGYGDPLLRNPDRVARDVRSGLVSVWSASLDYGVVLSEEGVDPSATAARRRAIRVERLGHEPTADMPSDIDGLPDVRVLAGRFVSLAGYDLGPASGDWKSKTMRRTVAAGQYGPLIQLHPELEIREFICPASGLLLEIEVVRKGQPSLVSFQLSLS
jgi:N-methylhydantoinase B